MKFKHYLATAFWTLLRQPADTALSVFVLGLGLICFLCAYLFARHLDDYDKDWPQAERIYVLYQGSHPPSMNVSQPLRPSSAFPVAAQIKLDVPELAAVARYFMLYATVSSEVTTSNFRRIAFVDSDWPKIFDFTVIAGDVQEALNEPGTAVVTRQLAESVFGTVENALGETLTLSDQARTNVAIRAVVESPTGRTHLADGLFSQGFDALVSWDVFERAYTSYNLNAWTTPLVSTYVLLPNDGGVLSIDALNERLRTFGERHVPSEQGVIELQARHVSHVVADTVQRQLEGWQGDSSLPLHLTKATMLVASLVLGVACLNFINLATAHSAKRTREIGVRKVLGAKSTSIFLQHLTQHAMTVVIALALALSFLEATARIIQHPWISLIAVPWSSPAIWAIFGLIVLSVSVAAGTYPALSLARIAPSRSSNTRSSSSILRASLIGIQFAIAGLTITAVTVLTMQAAALRTNLLGRFVDQYIVFPPVFRLSGSINLDVLTTELERYPGVRVTASNLYPWQPTGGAQARLRRDAGESDGVPADNLAVAHDFFGVMDIRVVAGRVFSRDRADDRFPSRGAASPTVPVSAVVDSVATRQLGWSNPAEAIGQVIYGAGPPAQIIGVVENTPLSYRSRGSGATVYFLAPQFAFTTYVRVDGSRLEESLAHVNRVVRALAPDRTTPHMFLDEAFEEAYRPWTVMGRISTGVALFASTIAAVGLFGMASFMTRRRTREIGVRKSQGASTISILRLLWWDFSKPVLLAYSFVVPIGYIATRSYLDLFVTRMDLTPLPFIYALLLSLVVAWVAVGSHVILAARVNPAVALRHE